MIGNTNFSIQPHGNAMQFAVPATSANQDGGDSSSKTSNIHLMHNNMPSYPSIPHDYAVNPQQHQQRMVTAVSGANASVTLLPVSNTSLNVPGGGETRPTRFSHISLFETGTTVKPDETTMVPMMMMVPQVCGPVSQQAMLFPQQDQSPQQQQQQLLPHDALLNSGANHHNITRNNSNSNGAAVAAVSNAFPQCVSPIPLQDAATMQTWPVTTGSQQQQSALRSFPTTATSMLADDDGWSYCVSSLTASTGLMRVVGTGNGPVGTDDVISSMDVDPDDMDEDEADARAAIAAVNEMVGATGVGGSGGGGDDNSAFLVEPHNLEYFSGITQDLHVDDESDQFQGDESESSPAVMCLPTCSTAAAACDTPFPAALAFVSGGDAATTVGTSRAADAGRRRGSRMATTTTTNPLASSSLDSSLVAGELSAHSYPHNNINININELASLSGTSVSTAGGQRNTHIHQDAPLQLSGGQSRRFSGASSLNPVLESFRSMIRLTNTEGSSQLTSNTNAIASFNKDLIGNGTRLNGGGGGGECSMQPLLLSPSKLEKSSATQKLNLAPNLPDHYYLPAQLQQQQQQQTVAHPQQAFGVIPSIGALPQHSSLNGPLGGNASPMTETFASTGGSTHTLNSPVLLRSLTQLASSPNGTNAMSTQELSSQQQQQLTSTMSDAAASLAFVRMGPFESTFTALSHVGSGPDDTFTLPRAAATYNGGEALQQRLDRGGCVAVVDPQRRKLRVPSFAIQPTKAFNGRLATPSLCLLFQSGRCRQGVNCYQVHADPEVVRALRVQAESQPCCCATHGDCNESMWDVRVYEAQVISVLSSSGAPTVAPAASAVAPAALPNGGCGGATVSPTTQKMPAQPSLFIPMNRLAYTLGLQKVLQESKFTVPVSTLCRLHGQTGGCRFGSDCKFLHVCREILQQVHCEPNAGPPSSSSPASTISPSQPPHITGQRKGTPSGMTTTIATTSTSAVQPPAMNTTTAAAMCSSNCGTMSGSRFLSESGSNISTLNAFSPNMTGLTPFSVSTTTSSIPTQMLNMSGSFGVTCQNQSSSTFANHSGSPASLSLAMISASSGHNNNNNNNNATINGGGGSKKDGGYRQPPPQQQPHQPHMFFMATSPNSNVQQQQQQQHTFAPSPLPPSIQTAASSPPPKGGMSYPFQPHDMNAGHVANGQHQQQQQQQQQQYVLQRVNADGSLTLMPVSMLPHQQQQQQQQRPMMNHY